MNTAYIELNRPYTSARIERNKAARESKPFENIKGWFFISGFVLLIAVGGTVANSLGLN